MDVAMAAETSRMRGNAGYKLPCSRSDSVTRCASVCAADMNMPSVMDFAPQAIAPSPTPGKI